MRSQRDIIAATCLVGRGHEQKRSWCRVVLKALPVPQQGGLISRSIVSLLVSSVLGTDGQITNHRRNARTFGREVAGDGRQAYPTISSEDRQRCVCEAVECVQVVIFVALVVVVLGTPL